MNGLTVLENKDFGRVRTVVRQGEPWFAAIDVCKALDVQNVSQAVQRLDEDERLMFNTGRQGEALIVSEPGLSKQGKIPFCCNKKRGCFKRKPAFFRMTPGLL